MTSAELRRIVGAMTERPWRWEHERCVGPMRWVNAHTREPCSPNAQDAERDDAMIIETDSGYYPPEDSDRAAIVTLANHADALVALVEAVERMHTPSIPYDVLKALSAVHDVKEKP